MWRQPTGDCYVAITSKAGLVSVDQTAKCCILGVKARFEGEVILEYAKLQVPVNTDLQGCVVDYMCTVQQRVANAAGKGASAAADSVTQLPLVNEQPLLEDREVISEPLYTGIKVCT